MYVYIVYVLTLYKLEFDIISVVSYKHVYQDWVKFTFVT